MNVAAAIVGQDIPTITYGHYSGGVSVEVKLETLEELIGYPIDHVRRAHGPLTARQRSVGVTGRVPKAATAGKP